jgi:hypothetical protein
MASQNPSTAYTAAPEKPKSFFSSFSLPKLPDFFGTGATAAPAPAPPRAPAPAPAAPVTAVGEQSSVQPGGRRRRGSKKAGRRHTRRGSKKGGIGIPRRFMPTYALPPSTPPQPAGETKTAFGPVQVRKGGRRTRRGGLTPMQDIKLTDADIRYITTGPKYDFPPTQVRKPTGKGRRTRRGGLTPAEEYKFSESEIREQTRGTKADFLPTQVRKPTGKGRRTHRVKKHSRR